MLIAYHGMARGSLDPTCGDRFTVSRALLCKGDFVAQRHDGIQSILTSLLNKVCKDVDVKPHLLPIDSDVLNPRSTVTSPEARLDIKAGSFWSRGETAFFDVCRTYVNSTCNQKKSTESIFLEYEKDKKRNYQQRVIDVKMGFPPPLVFWHERKKGEGMQAFSKQPSGQTPPPPQNGKSYASPISCFRTSTSFEIFTIHMFVARVPIPFSQGCRISR